MTPGVQGMTREELIENAEYFHVDRLNAEKRYADILNVVSGWRSLALKLNIRRTEIDRMSACFCQLNLA
jgi:hypothetical protein